MDAVDGVAHLLGLAHQGVALAAEILQQCPDTHLVVVIGVLERGHLVGDQSLELGGARQGALDAVAHRRHLAPDRLPDGHDRLARYRLRLDEPPRNVDDGLRGVPHLLVEPRHVDVEENHGHEKEAQQDDHRRNRSAIADHFLDVRQIAPPQPQPDRPGEGE